MWSGPLARNAGFPAGAGAGKKACSTVPKWAPVRNPEASARRGPADQLEPGSARECPEIPVSRKERNPVIDAALGDQCIAQARLAAFRQHAGS